MPGDMTEMAGESVPGTAPKQAGKTRLLTFTDLDRRTRAAQHAREVRNAIVADLGGEDRLSTLELLQAENAAVDAAVLRDMQCRWLKGEPVPVSEMATIENTFNRTAAAVGTKRRTRDITPLREQLLEQMRTEAPQRAEADRAS